MINSHFYTNPLVELDITLSVKVKVYKNTFTGMNYNGRNTIRFLDPVAHQQRINLQREIMNLIGGKKPPIK